MVHDLAKLQKETTHRRKQLEQMAAVTFPALKTFLKGSTAAPAARALLEHFATPQHLAAASTEYVAEVLRSAHAYSHAARAAELQALAQTTSGVPTLTHHQWRQGWLIKQPSLLENARQDLVDQWRTLQPPIRTRAPLVKPGRRYHAGQSWTPPNAARRRPR